MPITDTELEIRSPIHEAQHGSSTTLPEAMMGGCND